MWLIKYTLNRWHATASTSAMFDAWCNSMFFPLAQLFYMATVLKRVHMRTSAMFLLVVSFLSAASHISPTNSAPILRSGFTVSPNRGTTRWLPKMIRARSVVSWLLHLLRSQNIESPKLQSELYCRTTNSFSGGFFSGDNRWYQQLHESRMNGAMGGIGIRIIGFSGLQICRLRQSGL